MGTFKAVVVEKSAGGQSVSIKDFDENDLMEGDVTVGVMGGFKWSSQHLDGGGCDEGWETALGSGATSRVAGIAWPTRRGAAGEPAAVLGGDCGGSVERGRGDRGRRVARGGSPLVPGGGRHATDDPCAISEAAIGAVSGVR